MLNTVDTQQDNDTVLTKSSDYQLLLQKYGQSVNPEITRGHI